MLRPAPAAAAITRGPSAVTPVDPSVFQRFDAFFRTGGESSLSDVTAAGGSQLRLYGLRSDGAGGGSAIIGLGDDGCPLRDNTLLLDLRPGGGDAAAALF